MGIKEIEERIITDARNEAEKIKADYSNNLISLKNQFEEEKNKQSAIILKAFKEKAKDTKISLITPYLLSYKNEILLKKKELFEKVFSECMDDSSNLNDNEYKNIIKNLMRTLENEKDCFEIIPPKNKEKITKEALEEIKKEDKKKWENFFMSKENLPIKGGFIVKGKKTELNFSFETLWKKIKEQCSEGIAQILFEGI